MSARDDTPVGGLRTARVEAVVAALLLLVGLVTAYQSWQLGASWTDDGPGSGYFPFYIGLVICGASASILFKALRQWTTNDEIFVDRPSLRRVAQVFLPAVVYVSLMHVLGIYLASALYIAVFMVWLGGYPWVRSVLVGVVLCALFFLMFEVWFKVPLFKGAWNPTGFLGY